jgi:prohibitin 2
MNQVKLIGRLAWIVPFLYIAIWMGVPFTYVDTTDTAVVTTFGKVTGYLENGPHFVWPFQEVHHMQTQLLTVSKTTRAPTSDLQEVDATASFQFSLLPSAVGDLFENVGLIKDIKRVILDPGLEEELKGVTAKYTLADLLDQRDPASSQTRDRLEEWVKTALKARGLDYVINVGSLQLTNLDYSKVFKAAVAEKSEYAQFVGEAENRRKGTKSQAEGEAAEIMRQADAEATQIRLNAEETAKAMLAKATELKKNPDMLCYLLLQKWDGQVPSVQSGDTFLPFYQEACGKTAMR